MKHEVNKEITLAVVASGIVVVSGLDAAVWFTLVMGPVVVADAVDIDRQRLLPAYVSVVAAATVYGWVSGSVPTELLVAGGVVSLVGAGVLRVTQSAEPKPTSRN